MRKEAEDNNDPKVRGKSKKKDISISVKKIGDLFRNKRIKGFSNKCKVLYVMVMIRLFGIIEKKRIGFGAEPKR